MTYDGGGGVDIVVQMPELPEARSVVGGRFRLP